MSTKRGRAAPERVEGAPASRIGRAPAFGEQSLQDGEFDRRDLGVVHEVL